MINVENRYVTVAFKISGRDSKVDKIRAQRRDHFKNNIYYTKIVLITSASIGPSGMRVLPLGVAAERSFMKFFTEF